MKRIFFNITFTITFLLTFSLILFTFSDTLAYSFLHKSPEFPMNRSFDIASCQKWTEEVRDFNVKNGEEAKQITVLMYHKIIDAKNLEDIHYINDKNGDTLHETIVLKSEFEKQMKLLKKLHYTALTAAEFKLFMENKIKIPKKSILITFDDGFKSNFREAYPILKKNNLTALNFIITRTITEVNTKYVQEGYQYFSLPDIKRSCDVFDFQSHTYSFHQRNEKGQAFLISKSQEEIKKDIEISLFNLNKENPIFSYPYGEYGNQALKALKELNIGMAFTVQYEDARPGMNLYEIPRKTVFPTDTIEDFKEKINIK